MDFLPIFTEPEECDIWAVRFDGNDEDVFTMRFNEWYNTEFLVDFFEKNKNLLANEFWNGLSIDQAIEMVEQEASDFDQELCNVDISKSGKRSLKQIFKPLHDNKFVYTWKNEQHRKGKPDYSKFPTPFLRIYAIELEDGTLVVTGGAIKLTDVMDEHEKKVLSQVQEYLKQEGIVDRLGLVQSL